MLRLLLLALAVAFSATLVDAATVKSIDFKDGKTRLNFDGDIDSGDVDAIKGAIQAANQRNRMVVTIRLNSPGGNLLEAVKIADVIRTAKMATATLSGSKCASACFIVFAAGSEKYAHYTAEIGVHGASDEQGNESTAASAATVTMARVLRELGVPPAILGKMVVTPPDQMVWLTPDDLKSMAVTMLGKPAQLATTAQGPSTPLQVGPSPPTSVKASTGPTWKELVEGAAMLSIKQYGRLNKGRSCQPELKVCNNAIFYKTKDGEEAMVRTAEDIDGKIISRDLCSFNRYRDVRTCINWDTGRITKEMKSGSGDWSLVESK